jgi:hypothetical protein
MREAKVGQVRVPTNPDLVHGGGTLTTLFRSVCVQWLLIDSHKGKLHFTQLPFIYHHLRKLQFSREAKLVVHQAAH